MMLPPNGKKQACGNHQENQDSHLNPAHDFNRIHKSSLPAHSNTQMLMQIEERKRLVVACLKKNKKAASLEGIIVG
jgi:hypothetical protein